MAQRVTYLGVQVHGGMGFIEETGAAQYARDARITTIYEGTTGIQANDLVTRKIVRDEGSALKAALAQVRDVERSLATGNDAHLAAIRTRLRAGADALADAASFAVGAWRENPRAVLAGAVPMLELAGLVFGGAQLARGAAIAAAKLAQGEGDAEFMRAKIATARHFADHLLAQAPGLRDTIVDGSAGVLALADDAI
jgi:butyryl-CoA dehydrogenase